MAIVLLLLMLVVTVHSDSLSVKPTNSSVHIGQYGTFLCATTSMGIKWTRVSTTGTEDDLTDFMCNLIQQNASFSVSTSTANHCDLTIVVQSTTLAGTYKCTDQGNTTSSAQLIVIASSIRGSQRPDYVKTSETVTVECSVDYAGSPAPVLSWNIPSGVTAEVVTNETASTSVSTSILVHAPSIAGTILHSVACQLYFAPPTIFTQDSWSSTPLTVSQCPTWVAIDPPGGKANVRDTFTCSSNAIPPANYSWTTDYIFCGDGTPSEEDGDGSIFTVYWVGNFSLQCTATLHLDPSNTCSLRTEVDVSTGAQIGCNCFPGDSTVTVKDGQQIPMSQLVIGQPILTLDVVSGQLQNDVVIAFAHQRPSGYGQTVYIDIIFDDDQHLSMTPYHLIYFVTEDELQRFGEHFKHARFAKEIRQGDYVFSVNSQTNASATYKKVAAIDFEQSDKGLYSPLTTSGTLIVDGVLVSCYATIPSQRLMHWLWSPLRVIYWVLEYFGYIDVQHTLSDWLSVSGESLNQYMSHLTYA